MQAHELGVVMASSTSHVLMVIVGMIIMVFARSLWVFRRNGTSVEKYTTATSDTYRQPVLQAGEKAVGAVAIPTVEEFELARKCGGELGGAGTTGIFGR
jgi:hypothetical protein